MSEYRIGYPIRGIIGVFVSVILLIFIPKIILNVLEDPYWLESFLAKLGMDFDASSLADALSNVDTTGIQELLQRAIVSAIPLVVLAFPYRFYKNGSKGRMYVGVVKSIYCIGRYLYILNYGDLTGIFALNIDSTVMSFDVMLTGVLLVSIFLRVIRIPKYIAVYKDERDDFVDFHIVDGRWVNRSKRELKKMRKEKRQSEKDELKAEKRERKERIAEANGKKRGSKRKDDNDEDDDR